MMLAIPTLTRFDLLAQCVASALAGTVPPSRVVVIDNSGGQCPPIAGAEIILGRQPQSVAKAWNDAAQLARGDLVLSNDDITFAPDTIARMLEVAHEEPRAAIVSPIEGQRFSLFWLRWVAYVDIGPFDEAFEVAYFEDNDWARRSVLAGWILPVAPSAVSHVGSATIAGYRGERAQRQHEAYRANEHYYVRKWGAPPHHERFDRPFGIVVQGALDALP